MTKKFKKHTKQKKKRIINEPGERRDERRGERRKKCPL
jgi:hypothetical protein